MTSAVPTLNREHIRPGDRICAAVSGGADSVALLLLLHAANALPRHGLGVGLSAVHVHHGLRGEEADADLAFVEALCLRLAVPLHVHHANVTERMAASRAGAGKSEGCEEAARAIRYECFTSLIAQGHADSVLTAHTLDDQAETVLMKLLRGAWTEGLSGIHPVVLVDKAKPGARFSVRCWGYGALSWRSFCARATSLGARDSSNATKHSPATAFATSCCRFFANTIPRWIRHLRTWPSWLGKTRRVGRRSWAGFCRRCCCRASRFAAAGGR